MAPQVPGLFYSCKLQAIIAWWKRPQNFDSKKVLRWVEHGVKVEFKKGLPFAPKPSASKFVDPQDVDFAIQDLLKGRRIEAYQDLAPGGDQFLSRSRVHTPPGKGKQRIVHALCSLNETTVKRQTTYEDLRMLKSVVKPQDFMLSLDVESAFFHVPIHPKHRKFFSSHLALHLRHHYHQVVEFSHAALPLGWTSSPRIWTIVMSVVAAVLRRHGMCTLLYVDDLLITCSSFEEVSRARQIIEDTLLTAGIVHASLKGCFDTPTQTLSDHLVFIISSIGKGALRVPERRCFALCRQKRALLFETVINRHPRSLHHTRPVQAKIFPVSSSCRQPPLLAQLFHQEPREPARALARSTIYCPLHRHIGHHWLGLGVGASPRGNEIESWMVGVARSAGNDGSQGAQGVSTRSASKCRGVCAVVRSSSTRTTSPSVERYAKCHPNAQHS
jgi:hypothetical protein